MKVRKIPTSRLDTLFEKEDNSNFDIKSACSSSSASLNPKGFPTMSSLNSISLRPPSIRLPEERSLVYKGSSNSSFASSSQTDDEYGHYDDPEDLIRRYPMEDLTYSPIQDCSARSSGYTTKSNSFISGKLSALSTPTSVARLAEQGTPRLKGAESKVLCLVEDHQADLSCRSFESIETRSEVRVCVSLTGIRINHQDFREVAEYKVQVRIDQNDFIVWKNFYDFEALGEACRAIMNRKKSKIRYSLRETVRSWDVVRNHRPWLRSPNRTSFLLEESKLLSHFMKNLLFEIPCVEMLVSFLVDA